MSRFGKILRGTAKSNTMQFNGGAIASILALLQSDGVKDLLAANPQYSAYVTIAVLVMNLFLRAKTSTPLSER